MGTTVKMCRYRWPKVTRWHEITFRRKSESAIGQYVIIACQQPHLGEHSLAYKLKTSTRKFTPDQVAAECMNHLAAGIDTTGDALCFLLHQLSKPEFLSIQDKLITEIHNNIDKEIDNLPYLEAVIKEGLRCFPPIPMSLPRVVPAGGRVIDGYLIPGGTIVSCQAWSVHQLNPHVSPDGEKFMPERWLDQDSTIELNRLFFTFSAGGRSCTGKQ